MGGKKNGEGTDEREREIGEITTEMKRGRNMRAVKAPARPLFQKYKHMLRVCQLFFWSRLKSVLDSFTHTQSLDNGWMVCFLFVLVWGKSEGVVALEVGLGCLGLEMGVFDPDQSRIGKHCNNMIITEKNPAAVTLHLRNSDTLPSYSEYNDFLDFLFRKNGVGGWGG